MGLWYQALEIPGNVDHETMLAILLMTLCSCDINNIWKKKAYLYSCLGEYSPSSLGRCSSFGKSHLVLTIRKQSDPVDLSKETSRLVLTDHSSMWLQSTAVNQLGTKLQIQETYMVYVNFNPVFQVTSYQVSFCSG